MQSLVPYAHGGDRAAGRNGADFFFLLREVEGFMLLLWDFCGGQEQWLSSHQNSAKMSGGLNTADYKRRVHLVLQNRIFYDATCIRL